MPVTWGITTTALAPGVLFTVMPEVGPTPLRARATESITLVVHVARVELVTF